LYAFVYIAVILAAATLVFSRRNFNKMKRSTIAEDRRARIVVVGMACACCCFADRHAAAAVIRTRSMRVFI
jgi:hypothetical protein